MPAKKKATKKKVVKKAAKKKSAAKVTAKKKAVAKQKTKKEPRSKVLPIMMEQHYEIIGQRLIIKSLRNGILLLFVIGLMLLAILMSSSKQTIAELQAQLDNCSSNLAEKTICVEPPEGYFSGTEGAIKYNECMKKWIDTNLAPEITTIE